MVISRKLSKRDSQFLTVECIRKLASLILLPHSYPPQTLRWEDIRVANIKYVHISVNVIYRRNGACLKCAKMVCALGIYCEILIETHALLTGINSNDLERFF